MTMRRRLLPDMGLLQTFESAARHGNFSRAAEELNLTQSAVSRQIRELEQQTGLDLFERIRKRVVLSDAGAMLLPEVRQLLSGAERLMLGALSGEARGRRLRVATLPTFGSRWLVPRLGQFLARHPDVALTLESRDRPFSFQEEPIDLVIHYGQPVWPGGVTTFLCSELVVPVASRALAERLTTGGVPDLAAAHLLHLTGRPGLWSHWFERFGHSGADPWRGTRFDQFSMIIAAVQSGLGVGLLPSYLIEQETGSGELVQLFDQPMPTETSYYIILPEGHQTNPAAQEFRAWLLEQPRQQ